MARPETITVDGRAWTVTYYPYGLTGRNGSGNLVFLTFRQDGSPWVDTSCLSGTSAYKSVLAESILAAWGWTGITN